MSSLSDRHLSDGHLSDRHIQAPLKKLYILGFFLFLLILAPKSCYYLPLGKNIPKMGLDFKWVIGKGVKINNACQGVFWAQTPHEGCANQRTRAPMGIHLNQLKRHANWNLVNWNCVMQGLSVLNSFYLQSSYILCSMYNYPLSQIPSTPEMLGVQIFRVA